jgi:hypothetical protein
MPGRFPGKSAITVRLPDYAITVTVLDTIIPKGPVAIGELALCVLDGPRCGGTNKAAASHPHSVASMWFRSTTHNVRRTMPSTIAADSLGRR